MILRWLALKVDNKNSPTVTAVGLNKNISYKEILTWIIIEMK